MPCAVGPAGSYKIPTSAPRVRPDPVDAGSFRTKWPIKHVVFLLKENRSFDNFVGAFPGADGATVGMMDGRQVRLTDCIPQRLPQDLKHNCPIALQSYNDRRMDGFGVSEFARAYAYAEAAPTDILNYWRWAQDFTLGDNFFASALGPSYPNHLFTFAAQSADTHDNPVQETLLPGYLHRQTNGLAKSWGCDIPEGGHILVDHGHGRITQHWRSCLDLWTSFENPEVDPARRSRGTVTEERPCWGIPTTSDELDRARLPWAYYGATPGQMGYIWTAPDYIRHIRYGPE